MFIGLIASNAQVHEDRIVFHYSVMNAMRNGAYTGEMTIGELREKGDFGIGTYNYLDGEMIILDNVFYRVDDLGTVEIASKERLIPFASVAFFKPDIKFELKNVKDMQELQNEVIKRLPSSNKIYAIRIDCEFENITVGGAKRLNVDDTTGLAEVMKTRPLFVKQDVSGTMVGFYSPSYLSAVDLTPFHFHFISNDRKYGGHLMSGKFGMTTIKVSVDEKTGFEVVLPQQNKAFNKPWTKQSGITNSY